MSQYLGQPNPGARLPLPIGQAPEPRLTAAQHLAKLGHGFLLADAILIVSWPSSRIQLARHLIANGFTCRRIGDGKRRWYAPTGSSR